MSGADVRSKVELLRELGFAGARELAEEALREAGLSRPEKPNIHASKVEQVREALDARFFRACSRGDCQSAAAGLAGARQVVAAAARPHCQVCGGSANRTAVEAMLTACRERGWRRICVVGGAPDSRRDLTELVEGAIDLRLIEGTRSRTAKLAGADVAWADLVLIWGSTELAHKVSTLYGGRKVVTVPRRGIEALAGVVVAAAHRRA